MASLTRTLAFAAIVACNDTRSPDPVGAPSALPEPREASAVASAPASVSPVTPVASDLDLAGAEAKCANARGEVVVLSLLESCPSGMPKSGLNCQGSYDGWDLWWGTDAQADAVKRAGCPTAILCERGAFFDAWRRTHADAAREMIDHAEKRATPRPSSSTTKLPRVYACTI